MNFEELYEQHKDMVYNLALNYVQNHEDAQEITQDAFVSIYQSLDKFRHDASPATWIYRITINRCLDHIKARKRKKRFAVITAIFGSSGHSEFPVFDHPGIKLEQKQEMERIFRCINELPHNQKTALILSKTEHKTQAEIAAIMNVSVKAVESLVQRAKTNLSQKLNQSEGKT